MTPVEMLFARSRSPRIARRRSAKTRRLDAVRCERLEDRRLLAINPLTDIKRTSGDLFFTDFSRQMTSEYTSYTITDDGSGIAPDVWVQAVFPAGSPVGCGTINGTFYNNEDGVYHVGTLAPNVPGTAFLYLTAKSLSANPVPYVLKVFNGNPLGGGTFITEKAFEFTSVENTIQASTNQIDTVTYTPAVPVVGDTLDLKVTGTLGNNIDQVLFAPATYTSWLPDVFELRTPSISISSVAQPAKQIYFENLPGIVNLQPFTAIYSFEIKSTTPTPTPILPTQFTQDNKQ